MAEARIALWPGLARTRIAPGLYGLGLEHAGRGVHDGLWVGDGPRIPNHDGVRLDVLAALKQLRIPSLTWPGARFSQDYAWRNGLGAPESRVEAVNTWWRQTEPNTFGTGEFLGLCEALDCEAEITCNAAAGTVKAAQAWAEYCNFGGDSPLTRLRAKHGRRAPYGVRRWGVGAEPWEAGGRFDAGEYARRYARFANALRAIDPEAELVAAGADLGNAALDDWNHDFCAAMPHADLIDHLAVTCRFEGGPGAEFTNDEFDRLFEAVGAFEKALDRTDALLGYFYPDKRVGLALRQWGVQHPSATLDNGMEQERTLRDALVAGAVLNALVRRAHRVSHATLGQALNALHCLAVTDGMAMVLTPTYHVFDLMRRHMGARLTPGEADIPGLSVSASRAGKRLLVTVVNHTHDRDISAAIEVHEFTVSGLSGRQLGAENPRCQNTFAAPKAVAIKRLKFGALPEALTQTFPRHSLTALSLTLE